MSYPQNQYPQNPNYGSPPIPPYPPGPPYSQSQGNPMGTAALVCSIFGLLTCGLLSPISMLFGILGMRQEPKGSALAGLLISLFGLLMLGGVVFMTIATVRTAKTAFNEIQEAMVGEGTKMIVNEAARDVAQEWEDSEVLPIQQDGDDLIAKYQDLWGNAIIYDTDGESYSTRSAGSDQKFGTEDDIVAGPFETVETALEETRGIAELMKEEMEEAGIDPDDLKDIKDLEGLLEKFPEELPSEETPAENPSGSGTPIEFEAPTTPDEPSEPIMPIDDDPVNEEAGGVGEQE